MDDVNRVRVAFDGAAPNRSERRRMAKAMGMAYGDWKQWQSGQGEKAAGRFKSDHALLMESPCAECGQPMRAHPAPLYTPCPA